MRINFPGVLGDVWKLFRRDWDVLTAVAGLFVFLPSLASDMLIPDAPKVPDNAKIGDMAIGSFQQSLGEWAGHYAGWMLLTQVLALFGQFAIVALYLAGDRPAVSGALGKAARRFLLLVLASMIIGLPFGLIASVALLFPPLLIALVVLFFWLLARTLMLAPVLLAEAPIGAFGAIRRSLDLTRGNTFVLVATVMTIILAMSLLSRPFIALDSWMLTNAPNPIARAMVDAGSSAVVALGSIVMGLVQVAVYRRLKAG